MSSKTLIRGGCVLTLGAKSPNFTEADVLIEDGRIAEVGPGLRARDAEVVDATDTIVMPGFVDTHRHTWHSLFRNAGRGEAPISPEAIGPHCTPDHIYAATLIGLLGAVEAGITTVVDWADIPAEPPYVEAALQAYADAGLRIVFVAAGAGWAGAAPDPATLGSLTGNGRGPDLTVAYGTRLDALDDWEPARQAGLRIHTHAGSQSASHGVIANLAASGLLGGDVTLVHCTNLDEGDLDAIKSSGAMVSLAPSVEMTDGFGWPPLQSFIDRGIRPGLGIGSELEAPGDMFAQMRAAQSLQHATLFDLKLAGKGGVPNLLSTRDVIRHGTIDGAAAAGLGDTTGSLEPGKLADIVVLRTDHPNIFPVNDPIGAVVWGMDTSNIDWVFAGGRVLVRQGELTADVGRARELAVTAHQEVARAAGLLADSAGTGHQ